MNHKRRLIPALCVLAIACVQAQTTLYEEQFDNAGNGYNPDASTAMVGDNDWVDFANRIANNFDGNEGYFTAVGGTESVVTGSSNSNDIQIRTDFDVGLNKTEVGRIEVRVRIDLDQNDVYDDALVSSDLSLFWGSITYGTPGASNVGGSTSIPLGVADRVVAETDGWHVFIWNDKGGLTGGATDDLKSFRLDAVNNNLGASFEVDFLRILESNLAEVDPGPIGSEFDLREEWTWSVDGDLDGWTTDQLTVNLPGDVSGGVVTGLSTGGDAKFLSPLINVLDVESDRHVIELDIIVPTGESSQGLLFWAVNEAGNGFGNTQVVILPPVPDDGLVHTIRITLEERIFGRLRGLRYDPSNASGITSKLSAVRIYSEGPEIPFFEPPTTEIDPAAIGSEFLLVQEWEWDVDNDLDGWTPINFDIEIPENGGDTGIAFGTVFGQTVSTDPQFNSPELSVVPPASGKLIVEIDYEADPLTNNPGQLFWRSDAQPYLGERSISTPLIPSDGDPHTVRVTFDDGVAGTLAGLRIDPTNESGLIIGISAVRIYRDTTGNDYDTWAATQTWTPGSDGTLENGDFDGDGLSNNDERIFGLVPTSAASRNPIASSLTSGGTFSYTRRDPNLTGANFTVFTSTDLSTWTEDTGAVSTPTVGDLQTVSVTLSAGPSNGRLFVRVESE